jgi:hypothetical protein
MKYNFRDSKGKFTKQSNKVSKYVKPLFPSIVAGRLYGYRGTTVRAGQECSNGKRHVSFHKQLHGFVDESELEFIGKDQVDNYLQRA